MKKIMEQMKEVIMTNQEKWDNKQFEHSKIYKFLRTPTLIWEQLTSEFDFTLDACASDENHLLPKYYTEDNSCLDKDWSGEVVYCHPMFDKKIDKFVEKCAKENCLSVMLIPASTHTRYFHKYIYKKPNVEIRFLERQTKGWHFGADDGSPDDPNSLGYIKPLMVIIFKNNKNVK